MHWQTHTDAPFFYRNTRASIHTHKHMPRFISLCLSCGQTRLFLMSVKPNGAAISYKGRRHKSTHSYAQHMHTPPYKGRIINVQHV